MSFPGMYLLLLAGILSIVGNIEPAAWLGWIVSGLVVLGFLLVNRAYWRANPEASEQVRAATKGDAAITDLFEARKKIHENKGKYVPGSDR